MIVCETPNWSECEKVPSKRLRYDSARVYNVSTSKKENTMISKVIAWYNAGMITKAEAEKALQRYKQITEGK